MKKWKILLSALLASLALAAIPLTVLAQSGITPDSARQFKGGLAIVAPRVILAGNQLQLTVFQRINQEPVADAGIWLVSQEKIDSLKNDLEALKNNTTIADDAKDYEGIINLYAEFLGKTDGNGILTHTFNQPGNCALVAFEKGYWPDASGLAVRELPRALKLNAPRRAQPGEAFRIHVNLKNTNQGIEAAGAWAVTADNVEVTRAQIQEFKTANQANPANADWESEPSLIATRLGQTDVNGNLSAVFHQEGRYLLVTYKKGYIPAFAGVAVSEPQPATTDASPQQTPSTDSGETN